MPRYVLPGRQGRKGNYQIKVVAGLSVGLHLRLCPFYAYGNRQGAGSERSRTLHPRQICYGNNPTPPHRLYRPPPELSGGRNLVFVPFPTPPLLYFQAQGGGPSCRNPPTSKAAGPDRPLCFFPGHSGCSCPQDVPIHTALFRFFHVAKRSQPLRNAGATSPVHCYPCGDPQRRDRPARNDRSRTGLPVHHSGECAALTCYREGGRPERSTPSHSPFGFPKHPYIYSSSLFHSSSHPQGADGP